MRKSVIAVMCAAVLLAAGCGSGTGSTPEKAGGGTITIAIPSDPANLDPHRTVAAVTSELNAFTYDSLVSLDKNGKVISNLAEKWEGDASKATYTLRDDITCDDGSKLKASDVAKNFEFIKDPKNQATAVPIYLPSHDFTVEADDTARTFTIELAEPFAFLLTAAGTLPIVCPKGVANRDLLADGSVGSGPYRVVEVVGADHWTLEKRKGYTWGDNGATADEPGMPDKIIFRMIADETTRANLLLAGQVHIATFSGPERERVAAAGKLHTTSQARVSGELLFNQRKGLPGADDAVRRAMVQALDFDQVRKATNTSKPTGLVVLEPRLCKGVTMPTDLLPQHDIEGAKRALDEAGWRAGPDGVRTKDGKRLSVRFLWYTSPGGSHPAGAELITKMWEAVGIEVQSRGLASTQAIEAIQKPGGWEVTWSAINFVLPSQAPGFFSGPAPPDGQNYYAIDNPQYTKLTSQAIATAGEAGCQLWDEAERALFAESDVVPFAAIPLPSFGNGVTFEGPGYVPISIRVTR